MQYYIKLKKLLSEKKITLKELAESIGISEQGIHSMIRNDTMQIKILIQISEKLNVPVSYFFDEVNKGVYIDKVFETLKEMVKENMK